LAGFLAAIFLAGAFFAVALAAVVLAVTAFLAGAFFFFGFSSSMTGAGGLAATALNFFIMTDFLRAASLAWITLSEAALSRETTASPNLALASSTLTNEASLNRLIDVLAYLALLGAYFFFALRRLLAMKLRDSVIANSPGKTGVKQPPYGLFDQALLIGIIAGLVGYFAQIQFSFSTVGVSPIVWLLIALTFTVGDTRGQTGDRRPETGEFNLSVFPRPILIVFVLFVLFVLSIAAFFSVRQLVADFYFDQGVTAIEVPDSYTAGQAFDTAIGLNPHEADYSNFAGNIFIEVAKTSNDADAAMIALSTAVFYLDKATALNPDMPGYHYNLGNAKYYYSQLLGIDKTVAENTMKEALRQYRIAVTGDPFNPDIRFNLAGAYLRFSQKQQAIAQLKAGLALDPNRTVARETLKKLEAKQQ